MTHFFTGFNKRAAEVQQAQQEQPSGDWKKKYLYPGLAGAATAGGLFAATKSKYKPGKVPLVKAIYEKTPGRLRHWFNKAIHSADDIVYTKGKPRKLTKTEGVAVHTGREDYKVLQGKRNVGSMKDPGVRQWDENKRREAAWLNKVQPDVHNYIPSKKHQGEEALHRLMNTFKNKGEGELRGGFMLKPTGGFASGQGGHAFVQEKHIADYLAGKNIPKKKKDIIEHFMKNPHTYVAQQKMNIPENMEFRVHAIGGKVIPGASMDRTGFLTAGKKTISGAEKHLQKHLAKLPPNMRNAFMGADVVKTDKGYKILELNAGTTASGFLDPVSMGKEQLTYGEKAFKANKAIYKHLTGGEEARATTQLRNVAKGVGSVAAGSGVAYGTHKVLNHPGAQETIQTQELK